VGEDFAVSPSSHGRIPFLIFSSLPFSLGDRLRFFSFFDDTPLQGKGTASLFSKEKRAVPLSSPVQIVGASPLLFYRSELGPPPLASERTSRVTSFPPFFLPSDDRPHLPPFLVVDGPENQGTRPFSYPPLSVAPVSEASFPF